MKSFSLLGQAVHTESAIQNLTLTVSLKDVTQSKMKSVTVKHSASSSRLHFYIFVRLVQTDVHLFLTEKVNFNSTAISQQRVGKNQNSNVLIPDAFPLMQIEILLLREYQITSESEVFEHLHLCESTTHWCKCDPQKVNYLKNTLTVATTSKCNNIFDKLLKFCKLFVVIILVFVFNHLKSTF